MDYLRAMSKLLEEGAHAAFVDALGKEVEEQRVESLLESVREEHKQKGIRGASKFLRGLLRLAEERRTVLES